MKNPCLQPKLWEQPDQFSHVRYKESYSHRLRAENQIQEKAASGPSARRESEVHGLPSYTVTLPVDGHTKASFEARRVTLRFLSSVAFQAGVSEKDVSVVRVTAKPTDPRSLPAVEVTTKIVWDLSMLPRLWAGEGSALERVRRMLNTELMLFRRIALLCFPAVASRTHPRFYPGSVQEERVKILQNELAQLEGEWSGLQSAVKRLWKGERSEEALTTRAGRDVRWVLSAILATVEQAQNLPSQPIPDRAWEEDVEDAKKRLEREERERAEEERRRKAAEKAAEEAARREEEEARRRAALAEEEGVEAAKAAAERVRERERGLPQGPAERLEEYEAARAETVVQARRKGGEWERMWTISQDIKQALRSVGVAGGGCITAGSVGIRPNAAMPTMRARKEEERGGRKEEERDRDRKSVV